MPALGEAWWSLANLKTVRFDEDDIAAMQRRACWSPNLQDERPVPSRVRARQGAARCAAGRTRRSPHYAAGNALRRDLSPVPIADEITNLVDRCIELFTAEVAERGRAVATAADPIFIVGMPRAGSTLVEQILSSHSLVEGTSELPDIPALRPGSEELSGARRWRLTRRRAPRGAARNISSGRRSSAGPIGPFFIDKLPNNWMFVPFIHLVLPNAKIIDARRHPLGCCLSNFRQHFARGQDFTYDLEDLGRYYSDYVRLMAHVDAVLPGRVHRVIYERMVEDTEAEVRALLDYCGLEFEPACLEFYKTERAVRTRELGAGAPADLPRCDRGVAAVRITSGAAQGSAWADVSTPIRTRPRPSCNADATNCADLAGAKRSPLTSAARLCRNADILRVGGHS